MKISISTSEGMQSPPVPIAMSFTCKGFFLTLNLSAESYESEEDVPPSSDGSVLFYRCTTVSISSDAQIAPVDIMKILWQKNLYSLLDDVFLCEMVRISHCSSYDDFAAMLISGRYTYAEELACHRKALNGDTEELMTLNLFAEECKTLAKAAFARMNSNV